MNPIENLKQFLLPGFVLDIVLSVTIMRMARTMMLEVMRQDYISGINTVMASVILVNNLVVDLTYAYLDPRLRTNRGESEECKKRPEEK